MYVLPLIEVKGGESVHLFRGPGQGETRPLLDPVEVVNRFTGLGAQGFHIVDVDRATDRTRDNDVALVNVLEHTVLPVVAGGGVESMKRIQELLDTGVSRVLVGSMGVLHPDWLREAALIFRERLVPTVDIRGEELLVKGRTEPAPTPQAKTLEALDKLGLSSLHLVHLGTNGHGVERMEKLAKTMKTPLTYQGPVASIEDLHRLEKAGVRGVVLGDELYSGRLPFEMLAKLYRVH